MGSERRAVVCVESWAGSAKVPVVVLGHTAKMTRVRLLRDALIGRRQRKEGDVMLVPTYAVGEDNMRVKGGGNG